MRMTGIILILIGIAVALFCGVVMMTAQSNNAGETQINAEKNTGWDLTVPMIVAGVAFAAGVAMYVFGGRGYVVTDSTERNEGIAPKPNQA